MTSKKYLVTYEGLITENRFSEKRRGDPEERGKCPEAFLLSVEEAKTLYIIRDIIIDVNSKYSEYIQGVDLPDELSGKILGEYIAEIKKKNISYKIINSMYEKSRTALTWTATAFYTFGEKGKPATQEFYKITTNNPAQIPDRVITEENCPEFYKADNQAARARALGIPDLYLYVSAIESNILQSLEIISKQLSYEKQAKKAAKQGAEVVAVTDDRFIKTISSNILNAFYSIGANARIPEKVKSRDEKGRQITFEEYLNNLGDKLSFKDFNPFNSSETSISVGDPNADKLLLQIQTIVMRDNQQSFDIPLSDFMEFRGLSDRKTANAKADKASLILLNAQLKIDAKNENATLTGGINYMQECFVYKKKGRGGNMIHVNLSDKLFEHIISMSNNGQNITQMDKRGLQIPDNYETAYNIWRKFTDNSRINAGKPNSHRLSVNNLLPYSLLPFYPVNDEDIGKPNFLRYRSEAKERIIKPFIDALEYLVNINIFKEYTFTKTNGKALKDAELKKVFDDYGMFTALNVDVVFNNEPDYQHLIENKAKQKEKAEKAKKPKKEKN